jgi:hypothetical protein
VVTTTTVVEVVLLPVRLLARGGERAGSCGHDVFVRLVLQRACHPRVMAEGGQNLVPGLGQRRQDHALAHAQG